MDPLFWLYQDNFRTYNVSVAKKLGSVNAAIYLSELAQRFKYHSDKGELISHEKHGDGWFYYTMEKCEERTALSFQEQRTARAILNRLGLIKDVKFGIPGKLHFKVCMENILKHFGFSNNISRNAESTNSKCRINKQQVQNQQTPQYIEDTEKRQTTTTTTNQKKKSAVVVLDLEKINEVVDKLSLRLVKASVECGEQWNISKAMLYVLAKKWGASYLIDQVNYMFDRQKKALHDEKTMKIRKVKKVDNPESYLRMACDKNYAMSEIL